MKNLNIILLEDNAFDAELSQLELKQHLFAYQLNFKWVTNKKDFLNLLEEFIPDLMLSDYNLASYTGMDALHDFQLKFPFTPFIFVTGTQKEEIAAEAIKEGAWDFVVKDRLSRLTMAVQNAIKLHAEQLKNIKVQETVAKSELRFRTLFNSASDAIFMMQGPLFIDCNVATEIIFGCGRDQIVGQTPIKFSPYLQPSGLTSEELAVERINAALDGVPQFFEWQHIKYNGQAFDAEVSLNRLKIGEEIFIQAIVRDITTRKKAEADNVRLAMVANTTNNIVIIANSNGEIEWVNKAFTTITEFSFDEAIGKKPGHLLQGPDTHSATKIYMSQQIAEGKGFKDVEIINYTKSGKPYWISIEVQSIHDHNNVLRQFIAIESDITDRKMTQLALANREKRFSNLVQQSPIAVIEWDTTMNVKEWNEAAENIFGYSRDEAMGRSAFGLILPLASNEQILTIVNLLLSQQSGNRNTNSNITKIGTSILCDWYNRPLTDDDGKTIGIVSMVEDITDRVKIETELKESELKFRQIIQSCPLGTSVYELDSNDKLILIDTNPASNIMSGLDTFKLIGKSIEEAFPNSIPHIAVQQFILAAKNGTPWYKENIIYKDNMIAAAFQIYAFQAGHNRVAIMANNVTERRQSEEAIAQKNDELTKVNTELDRFVYSASHDLRAPIASLLGLVEVARLEKDLSGIGRLLDMQKRSLLKLDYFISDIVNYSRNNRQEIQAEDIDFKTLIDGIFEQLQFIDQLQLIKRIVTVSPDLNFRSDAKRISVILNNLISNAIKYSDVYKTNPFIEIKVDETAEGVTLCVADNGEGINDDQLPKIFEMFYRATQRSTGSGIGLYIVNEITQKLKGKIEVESKFGEGSKFYVRLPNI